MIHVSQWRVSIGLWNYCQATSGRPANGRHSHSFKSGEKTSKLPAALSLIVSRFKPTGIIVTIMICLQSLVLFTIGSSSNLIYYLVLLLLLLSGDVELNPGPMIDDQPTCLLFENLLKPLVDWKPFALCLPGITQSDINIIDKAKGNAITAVCEIWLQANPQASWRDVIAALEQCKESELVKNIEHQMKQCIGDLETHDNVDLTSDTQSTSGNDDSLTSIPVIDLPTVSSSSSAVSVINKPVTGTTSGNPKDILRTQSHIITDAITTNLYRVTDVLYAKGLIPLDTKEYIQTVTGISDYRKSSQLVSVIQRQLESSLNPEQYLIDISRVLINQQHCTLTDIATSILHQLGQSIPDNVSSVSSHTVLPSPVDDKFNTNNIADLINAGTRIANNFLGESGEIPREGSTIKYNIQGHLDGRLEWKWVCTCEDTRTGLKIKGPPKPSRAGALEQCLKALEAD